MATTIHPQMLNTLMPAIIKPKPRLRLGAATGAGCGIGCGIGCGCAS